jgi:secretion/DNA translocation related CpaE-like protein
MDADPLGGGLDVLLGRERFEEARWPEIVRRADSNSGDIYDVLPRLGELSLLSWDRGEQRGVPPDVVRRVIDVAKRGSDVVIVDLPRAPDDAAKVALGASDALVVVVPAEVRSVAAAARVIAGVRSYCDRVHVVVCTPSPVGLKPSEIATALHLPLLGTMAFEPALALAIEKGAAFSGRRRTFLHELSELILHRLTGRAGGNV